MTPCSYTTQPSWRQHSSYETLISPSRRPTITPSESRTSPAIKLSRLIDSHAMIISETRGSHKVVVLVFSSDARGYLPHPITGTSGCSAGSPLEPMNGRPEQFTGPKVRALAGLCHPGIVAEFFPSQNNVISVGPFWLCRIKQGMYINEVFPSLMDTASFISRFQSHYSTHHVRRTDPTALPALCMSSPASLLQAPKTSRTELTAPERGGPRAQTPALHLQPPKPRLRPRQPASRPRLNRRVLTNLRFHDRRARERPDCHRPHQ